VDSTDRFAEVVAEPDSSLHLDEAVALLAAHAYPGLDPSEPLGELDRLADAVREPTLDGLSRLLFRDLAFAGNRDDYYDPRNSYINDVLERRLGIPISLAVVTIEVGRRLSVPIDGVGMPGHFLVRDRVDRSLFIDVFEGGARLDSAGCERLFTATTGATGFTSEFLEPVPRLSIVARMLANLEQIHRARADLDALTWVLGLQTRMPDAAGSRWSALGVVLAARGRYDAAAGAFEAAAERTDNDAADELLARAQQSRARLN
jgi:regulator of sirC expression with transglutaminase-like and TPR domain